MKNFKKKDSVRKCFIDTDCIDCNNIKECHDECLCDPNDSVLMETLPTCSCCNEHICECNRIIAKGKGKINDINTNLEFNFLITDNHGCLCGDLAVADYKSNLLLSSSNLLSYNQCTPCSFCAVFCEGNHTQTRSIMLCCLTEICGNPPKLFVYSPPFCGVDEVSSGGSINNGYIKIENSGCCC